MFRPDHLCGLCEALFRDLCRHEKDPVLCRVYEDYVTGKVKGTTPLEYVIRRVGMAKIGEAAERLRRQGVVVEEVDRE